MERKGFQKNFIDPNIDVPMPELSPQIYGEVVREEIGVQFDYINYSVIMHKQSKQPLVVGLNIDQSKIRSGMKRGAWKRDTRVSFDHQLENWHYKDDNIKDNPYDKGHMAMKKNASWGKDDLEAQRAANDTMYYTNAAFQRDTMNRDEWLELEKWVQKFSGDSNNRLSVFTGPILTPFDRYFTRSSHSPVRIPSAFFKVVCFKNKTDQKLGVRAFIMWQDEDVTKDFSGGSSFVAKTYQASVREIEERTGLEFHNDLFKSNPNFYYDSSKARNHNVSTFPEVREINVPQDILAPGDMRDVEVESSVKVVAALVNPMGNYRNEWVSIMNVSPKRVNLAGWTIKDKVNRTTSIGGTLDPGRSKRISLKETSTQLANSGGSIGLYNTNGELVHRVGYSADDVVKGEITNF